MLRRSLPFVVALSILLLPSARSPRPLDAHDWTAPVAAAPGLELTGEPGVWQRVHAKALDPVFDGAEGRAAAGDLMGFYFDQEVDRLSFRLNLFRAPGTSETDPVLPEGMRAFVLLDYADGGSTALPDGIRGDAPFAWDRAIELTDQGGDPAGRVLDPRGDARETERIRRTLASPRWGAMEASVWLPGGFADAVTRGLGKPGAEYATLARDAADAESTPIRFYVFTARDGHVVDDLTASNEPVSPAANAHNVAFVQHGNQGFSYTTVFRGERGENAAYAGDPANPDDGFDEILAAHDYYQLPLNWHQGGLLIGAAEWHDPAFNDWLLAGVNAGRYEILTSAYGQHIMPFVRDEINGKAVDLENDMIQFRYNYTPRVAWVPERVWVESPDDDGNGVESSAGVIDYIEDDFTDNGVWAVLLDDYLHCGYNFNAFDDNHIYTYANGIKILPINNNFVGEVNNSVGDAWNRILGSSSDEIIIYGNDAEFVAEVSQGTNQFALGNYIWLLQQCSNNAGAVGVWKLTDVLLDPGFTTQPLNLQNGTYGLLGGLGGYGGGNNSWYIDYAGYTGPSNLDGHNPKWNYGQQWDFALNKILSVPDNDLREMAWYVLLTNLHETGWHDAGQISGWQHHYANHIRSANAHSEAARWAAGLYVNPTGAYLSDFEEDGAQELVLYNDRLLAVFDSIGGKLQWLFAKGADYGYSVVSNDNVYWVDTDGDYNETNHVAGLSDVGVGGSAKDFEFYGLTVLQGSGTTVSACLDHPAVKKTVTLTLGNPYLEVEYRSFGAEVYVKNGLSPDPLDMTWTGDMDRVWDPDGGGYFGQKNPNTSATAAIVVGAGGASHNVQYDATLLGVDEFRGTGCFQLYFYGGYTGPLDGQGHVPELKALRDGLTDTAGPMPLGGVYYPASNNLALFFDQGVSAATVAATGIGIDATGDLVADVTLSGSDAVLTAGTNARIDVSLGPASAAAVEALNPAALKLILAAGALEDQSGNPNLLTLCGQPVAPAITVAPITKIQIDGLVDTTSVSDWAEPKKKIEDFWDSAWNGSAPGDTNEINAVLVDWDETYLYLAVQGFVSGNSWILYLDADFGGLNGESDLTAIDAWERGATFTAQGFLPDFQLGAYQHQGPFDSQSFFRIDGATTTTDLTGQVVLAFDPSHLNGYSGGSEIAVPWDVLYGLGPGVVPAGAEIAVVASVCYDPEPGGQLGGDSAPSNLVAALPTVDNACHVVVDGNGDGLPDVGAATGLPTDREGTGLAFLRGAFPNPAAGAIRLAVSIPGAGAGSADAMVRAEVFDVTGRRVRVLYSGRLPEGDHQLAWDGRDHHGADAGAGIFFARVAVEDRSETLKIVRIR